jgi:hypothetical protein
MLVKKCDCKNCWFISVTAKKKKELNHSVATIWRDRLQPVVMCGCKRKPDFVCVVEKLLGYLEYDCKHG